MIRFCLFLLCAATILSVVMCDGNTSNPTVKVRLGGLFAIYARRADEQCDRSKMFKASVQRLEMVLYTIEQVNKNKTLLPGIELELQPEADCVIDSLALSIVLHNFSFGGNTCGGDSRKRIWGVIGTDSTAASIPVAKLLGILEVPQISGAATSAELSRKERYPYFFRTVSSDANLIDAFIQLLIENKWFYVIFIYENNKYGTAAFDVFNEKIRSKGLCLAQNHKLPRKFNQTKMDEVVRELIAAEPKTKALPVIAFAEEFNLVKIFQGIKEMNATHRFQWLGADSWSNINYKTGYQPTIDMSADDIKTVMDGAVMFLPHSAENPAFKKYLQNKTLAKAKQNNPFYAHYLALVNNCSLEKNLSNSCKDDDVIPRQEEFSLKWEESNADCVLAYAHALESARRDLCGNSDSTCLQFQNMNGSLLKDYLQNVSYMNGNDIQFRFDNQHDGPAYYDAFYFDDSDWKPVGKFTNNELNITKKQMELTSKNVTSYCSEECPQGEYRNYEQDNSCCWRCESCSENHYANSSSPRAPSNKDTTCVPCKDTEKVVGQACVYLEEKYLSLDSPVARVFVAASICGMVITICIGILYARFWNTAMIRASGRELSGLILFGVLLIFATPIFFCMKPSLATCIIRKLFLGVGFAAIFAGLSIKTIRIALVFNFLGKRLDRDYKLLLRPAPQFIIGVLLTVVEMLIIVLTCLHQLSNDSIGTYPSPLHEEDRYNYKSCMGLEFPDILLSLTYPLILILICAYYAFKVRKVPTGFNEARHIAFVVYTTLVIWLAQLSTYFAQSTRRETLREIVYCLFLLLNALIMLLAFFGPKVHIVLFRPSKNNPGAVMGTQARNFSRNNSFYSTTYANGDDLIKPRESSPVQKYARSMSTTALSPMNKHCSCCSRSGSNTESPLSTSESIDFQEKNHPTLVFRNSAEKYLVRSNKEKMNQNNLIIPSIVSGDNLYRFASTNNNDNNFTATA